MGEGIEAKAHEYYNGGGFHFTVYTIDISQKDGDLISSLTWCGMILYIKIQKDTHAFLWQCVSTYNT